MLKAVNQSCSIEQVFLKISQNSQENTCGRVAVFFVKKEALEQVICDIVKNNFFYGEHPVAASISTFCRKL